MSAAGSHEEPAKVPEGPGLTVRMHAPRQQIVLVEVAGAVDESTLASFAGSIVAAFDVALHVVVDLSAVTALTRAGVRALLDLDRAATRHGTQLHISVAARARSGGHGAAQLLDRLDSDHLLHLIGPQDPVVTGSMRR